jgi:hypothetical protein
MFTEEDLKFLDPFAETLTNLKGVGKEEKEALVHNLNGSDDNAEIELTTSTRSYMEEPKKAEGKKPLMLEKMSTVAISERDYDDENVEEA